MNKEEKEAIEYLKEICDDYVRFFEEEHAKKCEDYKRSKTLIDLIDKQQKEIEKLQRQLEEKTYLYNKLNTESHYLVDKQQKEIEELGNRKAENYYNWQHLEAKIINKMKELEEMPENQYIHLHYIKKILKELLGKVTLNSLYGTMTKESEDNK